MMTQTQPVGNRLASGRRNFDASKTIHSPSRVWSRALSGDEVIIARDGGPIVEIRPAAVSKVAEFGSHEWLFSRTVRPAPGSPTSVELLNMVYDDPGS
jgi:antitoxin (DNA-binding transcriptional repressor) of toxin-antitoxin stability system